MAKKVFSFKALETDVEVKFIKREVKRTNTNISAVIKKLIQNAIEEEEEEEEESPKAQTETLKAELKELKKIGLLAAESATFAKHIASANYGELVKDNQRQIEEMKNSADELTKEIIDGIQ
ncbi:MAG: hypothetical protein ABIK26_01520 [Candidatus Omnitrophota bacterium]